MRWNEIKEFPLLPESIITLKLSHNSIRKIESIQHLQQLRELHLQDNPIDDRGMQPICALINLTVMDANCTKISKLTHFAGIR